MKYIVVGLMLLLSSGCSEGLRNTSPQTDHNQIRIALMVPLSGASSTLGNSIAQAAKMATQDITQTRVHLEIIDTGSEAAINPSALEKVQSGNFRAVVGPLFANHTRELEQATSKKLTILSLSNDISLAGKDNVYLAGFLPEQQIDRITKYAAMHGYNNIYALLPRNRYGEVITKTLEKGAQEQTYTLQPILYYDSAATMQSSAQQIVDATMPKALELSEITDENHNKYAILIPEGGAHLTEIMNYITHNKGDDATDVRFIGSSQWHEKAISSLPALNHGWIAAPPQKPLEEFRNRYKETFGAEPFDIAVLGYDLTKLIGTLLQNTTNINAELKNPEGFTGFAGTFRFIENGSNQRNLGILEIRNGEFVEISPSDEWF